MSLPTHLDVQRAEERIAGQVVQTPVLQSHALNEISGAELFLKAECLQETGSFKLRGATNRLLQIPAERRANGVVAFSSGNHAQGIARAAKRLGMPALIVMPLDAPQVKVDGVRSDGAEIHFYERNTQSREEIAAEIAEERSAVLVPSFDDPMIVAGQGTCGLEFAAQVDPPLDHLICCAGGGGLISGIALAFEGVSPSTKIWTAEPEGHEDWARSLEAGEVVSNEPGTRSICDAILTPKPGQITWAVGSRLLSGGCIVSDDHVKEAMRLAHRHLDLTVEPGGAAALAAALFALPEEAKGKRVGVILTGRNVDPDMFQSILNDQ